MSTLHGSTNVDAELPYGIALRLISVILMTLMYRISGLLLHLSFSKTIQAHHGLRLSRQLYRLTKVTIGLIPLLLSLKHIY